MHSQVNPEESACEREWGGEEDNSQQGNSHDKSEGGTITLQQLGSSPFCHPTDKFLHPQFSSLGSEYESEGAEEGKKVTTQEDVTIDACEES